MIYYYKDKLNPADGPFHHPNYMNKNEKPDITITKLMSILLNKLYLNRLGLKELATTSLKINK